MSSPQPESRSETPVETIPDTRERILRATWRLVEARKEQSVRVEDIARAANVSRQAVYLHFGSRTALFIATVRYVDEVLGLAERIQVLAERIRQARETGNGALGIEEYVRFWAGYIPEIYGLAKALLILRESDEAAAAAWADRMEAVRDGCLQTLRQVEQKGSLAPEWTVEAAADYFWAALSIPTWEQLTIERGWSSEQYIERITLAVRRALLRASEGE
jgi:AcrR family transcriptional regulator